MRICQKALIMLLHFLFQTKIKIRTQIIQVAKPTIILTEVSTQPQILGKITEVLIIMKIRQVIIDRIIQTIIMNFKTVTGVEVQIQTGRIVKKNKSNVIIAIKLGILSQIAQTKTIMVLPTIQDKIILKMDSIVKINLKNKRKTTVTAEIEIKKEIHKKFVQSVEHKEGIQEDLIVQL